MTGYVDSVPTKSVRLQNVGGAAHSVLRGATSPKKRPRDSVADAEASEGRKKADASEEGRNPELVSVAVKSEDAAYGEDTDDEDNRKPAAVTSGVAVKSEDKAFNDDTDEKTTKTHLHLPKQRGNPFAYASTGEGAKRECIMTSVGFHFPTGLIE